MAGLETSSLQELHVSLYHTSPTFPILHLSKFNYDAGIVLSAAQSKISPAGFSISMFPHSHSIDYPPFRIISSKISPIMQISSGLSAMLAAVEDILLDFLIPIVFSESFPRDLVPWCRFFKRLCNVKILRVHHHGLEVEVGDMLRLEQGDGGSTVDLLTAPEEGDLDATILWCPLINISKSQFTLDILPSLEEIEILAKSPGTPISESECCIWS